MSISSQPNGTYTWSCSIDPEYHRDSIRPGFIACIIIAVFLLLFGAFLSFQYHDWNTFLIVAGCTAVFMLISIFFFRLAFSAKDPHESYELTDIYVKTGYGRSSVYFDFDKIRQIRFKQKYIELKDNRRTMRVYTASEEDMAIVKRHIMNRLKGDTDIRYE